MALLWSHQIWKTPDLMAGTNMKGGNFMKKIYTAILFLSAAFALSSCVEQIETPVQSPSQDNEFETMTITVLETKSYYDSNTGCPKWSANDKIHVFDQDGQRYTFKGEASANESFVFTYDKWPAGKVPTCALFNPLNDEPAYEDGKFSASHPSNQTIQNVGSYGKNVNTSVAMIESDGKGNYTADFKNVCGYIKFKLTTTYVKNITIESVDGTPIAGDIKIDYNNGTPTYELTGNPMTSISVTPKSESKDGEVVSYKSGSYYACLLPCDLNGIKVTITNMNGRSMSMSGSALMKITRNNVIDLGTLDQRTIDMILSGEENIYNFPTAPTKTEGFFKVKDNFNVSHDFSVYYKQGYQWDGSSLKFIKDTAASVQLNTGYISIPAYDHLYLSAASASTLNTGGKWFIFYEDKSVDGETDPQIPMSTEKRATHNKTDASKIVVAEWTFTEGVSETTGYTLPGKGYYLTLKNAPTLMGTVHLEYTFTSLAPEAE